MPRLNLPKMKQGGETGRIDKSKMCETCGKKHASFGLKGLGSKKQWCGPCAKEQAGETELIGANICETCGKKQAHFGLKGGKRQWCGPCAERHGGAWLLLW